MTPGCSGGKAETKWATLPSVAPHPRGSLGRLAGQGPPSSRRDCLCSNPFCKGAELDGGKGGVATLSSRPWENATAARPLPRPPTKRRPPPRNQSGPLWSRGRLQGHQNCTPGTRPRLCRHPIPAPAGAHLQGSPKHPQEGDEGPPFGRNSTPSREGINYSSPSLPILGG